MTCGPANTATMKHQACTCNHVAVSTKEGTRFKANTEQSLDAKYFDMACFARLAGRSAASIPLAIFWCFFQDCT